MIGSDGEDVIHGSSLGNVVSGGLGDDILVGYSGAEDILYDPVELAYYGIDEEFDREAFEAESSDILIGGKGSDILRGGAGRDLLVDLDAAVMTGSDVWGPDEGGAPTLRDVDAESEHDVFVVRGDSLGTDTTTIKNFHLSEDGIGLAGRSMAANDAIVFSIDAAALATSGFTGTRQELYQNLEFTQTAVGATDDFEITALYVDYAGNRKEVGSTIIEGMATVLGADSSAVVGLEWLSDEFEHAFDGQNSFNSSINMGMLNGVDGGEFSVGMNVAVAIEKVAAGTVRAANEYGVLAANTSDGLLPQRVYNPGDGDDRIVGSSGADKYSYIVQAFQDGLDETSGAPVYDAGADTIFDLDVGGSGDKDVLSFSGASINDLVFNAISPGRGAGNDSLHVTYEQAEDLYMNGMVTTVFNKGEITWQGHFAEGGLQALETVKVAEGEFSVAQAVYEYDRRGYVKGDAEITAKASGGDAILVGQHVDGKDTFVFEAASGDVLSEGQDAHFWNLDVSDTIDLSSYVAVFGAAQVGPTVVGEYGVSAMVTFEETIEAPTTVLNLFFHDSTVAAMSIDNDILTFNQVT